jgi:hypothetical protein
MSKWSQARKREIDILRESAYQNRFTCWTSTSTAPTAIFPQTTRGAIAHALAVHVTSGQIAASAYTIRVCNHDGKGPHLNLDLRVFQEKPNGAIVQWEEHTKDHRIDITGSSAWEDVRHLFHFPSSSQIPFEEFLSLRG